MKKFTELVEQKDTVVFTFGRFNPPTTGHEKLIQKVKSVAGSQPFRIYPSFSQNQKKDPLPHALKIAYMRKMFSKFAKNIVADKNSRTAIDIAVKLYDEGFKNLTMVVGSDRVKEFQRLLSTYNGVGGKRHGYYKFDSIDVVSAGERDPDAEGVEGMSASKMRMAASVGDFDSFEKGVPSGFKDAKKLYLDVRKYMGIREQKDMGEMTDFETLRDMYLTGQIWNIDDLIEANGVEGRIVRRGTNYIAFNDRDGKVHKAWLHEVTINERKTKQDPEIKGSKGTEPAKYYAKDATGKGMAKSTKQKRDAHFTKGTKMDDDDPSAYKPAPGDATAKTKPSKYTKKFKQMYGEMKEESTDEAVGVAARVAGKVAGKMEEDVLNEKIAGLVKKSDKSGIAYGILKTVYDRGMAAWRTGHRPGTTPQQWAFARVNSFITGGGARKSDADQWKKHKGKSEDFGMIPKKKKKGHEVLGTGGAFASGEQKEEVAALLRAPLNEAEYVNFGIPDTWIDKRGEMEGLLGKFDVNLMKDVQDAGDMTIISVAKELAVKFRNQLKRRRIPYASDEEPIKKREIGKDLKSVAKRITQKLLRKNELKKFSDVNEWGEITEKAEYDGRPVDLNNPTRGDTKKYKVYVKNEKGNVVKIEFGDPNMEIKRDDPARRANFRARHNCDNPGPKYKARYWSCKFWSAKSVTDLMKG